MNGSSLPHSTQAAVRAVEDGGVARNEARALRNPPRDGGVFARELGRSVRESHLGRIADA